MKLVHSPLFEPVLWEGRGFKILDETLIPERIEYIRIDQVVQAIDAVREMKTRAFGQVLTFLYSGAMLARDYRGDDPSPLRDQLADMTERFCAARPTFDFKGLGDFFSRWIAGLPAGAQAGERIAEQAREFAEQIIKARLARAERMAALLPDSARLLTHCNVSGELVAIAQFCRSMGKEISVIATETRPYLQGSRLTAWELAEAGVSVSLVPDCAAAQVMDRGEVNAVVVGSDRCAQNGDVINKVGTYPLALMAKQYGVPFHVLVQDPGGLVRGEDVTIEERSAAELLEFHGRPLVAEGAADLACRYPAFDMTPASLISSLVGFDDLFTPESFRKKYLKMPSTAAKNGSQSQAQYLLVYGVPSKENYSFLAHALKAEQAHSVLVPEMRPQLWGARVVARELLSRKTPTTLISDNMMGTLFAQGEIRKLCLFYDGLSERGPRGICGSLLAVRLACHHKVPIELLASETPEGGGADRDVSTFLGQRICPAGVSVHPIESEILPWAIFKNASGASS
jgi:methylthioribose-1-phosphate isomerase